MVEKINYSITEKKRILLKGYHSLNTQKISDRIIEPIALTDNYNSVCGFEVETQLNKYYNLERITEVVIIDEVQEFGELHQLDEIDVFGFSEKNGLKFSVELLVSLRAYILLKEQYPKIDNHITREINAEKYRVKIDVNNPKPITRFILGLNEDIEILGSKFYIKYYDEIIMKL
jgi:predicted DNA-binding transcriptional regulator YafY